MAFPSNQISKFQCRILSGLLHNEFSVSNSKESEDHIYNFNVNSNETFVSFDVASLFTTIPVDKALDLVLEFLSFDESPCSSTLLDIFGSKHVLELCLYSAIIIKILFTSKPLVPIWTLVSLLSRQRIHGTH